MTLGDMEGVHDHAAETRPHGQDRLRLETVGLMTAGIVHDLGNMTQVVASAMNILKRHPSVRDAEGLQPVVDGAVNALEQVSAMIGLIVGFGRSGADDEVLLDVTLCLAGLDRILRWAVPDSVIVDISSPPNGLFVRCNRHNFENALLNLVINASDAMPTGGTVRVQACNSADNDRPAVVTVHVVDTGEGMAPEVLARAFEPFFTTKPAGSGNGLGLAMVRQFAHSAGGSVLAQSQPGAGTTITLHLPGASEAPIVQRRPR
jgi:signal transduction histidine kinase